MSDEGRFAGGGHASGRGDEENGYQGAPVAGRGDGSGTAAAGARGPTLNFPRPRPGQRSPLSGAEMAAAAASLFWIVSLVLILVFARTEEGSGSGFNAVDFVMTLMAVFLPVALVWVAASSARSARIMREESRRLQAAIDQVKQGLLAQGQQAPQVRPGIERKLDEIARVQRKTEAALATFVSIRGAEPESSRIPPRQAPAAESPREEPAEQPSLALDTRDSAAAVEPLASAVLIAALNFPESADDAEGFRALRRALQHRQTAQLIQASQDVLTLLSQDGIYMDDLTPDRARPELWRRFAGGERGGAVAPLGGIRDRNALAQAASRMRKDMIFRDAVHHFLRKFDQMLSGFGPSAEDAELAALAETRTARAFMLLGRVTGAFD